MARPRRAVDPLPAGGSGNGGVRTPGPPGQSGPLVTRRRERGALPGTSVAGVRVAPAVNSRARALRGPELDRDAEAAGDRTPAGETATGSGRSPLRWLARPGEGGGGAPRRLPGDRVLPGLRLGNGGGGAALLRCPETVAGFDAHRPRPLQRVAERGRSDRGLRAFGPLVGGGGAGRGDRGDGGRAGGGDEPVGTIADFVEHGRHALLVPPRDAGELAHALDRPLGDAGLRSRLAAAGHELAAHRSMWRARRWRW
jgi:hypothetical protein